MEMEKKNWEKKVAQFENIIYVVEKTTNTIIENNLHHYIFTLLMAAQNSKI